MRRRYKYLMYSGILFLVLVLGAFLGRSYIQSGLDQIKDIFIPKAEQLVNFSETCVDQSGVWVEKYKECESIPSDVCYNLGGEYYECDSPCRHMGPQAICIQMCVSVCKFK